MFPSPFARLFGIKSAPFATNNTVTNRGNLPETGLLSKSYHLLCIALFFAYCGAIFALPEAFYFGYSGAIFERSRSPFIDYSGAKYTRFPPKIAAEQKALFRVVENCDFLKRLRNFQLEKSAFTGLFCA